MSKILEHDAEVAPGLPAALPGGEKTLWQGKPDWKLLARSKFHLVKLALYFAIVLAAAQVVQLRAGETLAESLSGSAVYVLLALFVLALTAAFAWANARATVFTITSRRLIIRCGVALPLSVNLPFSKIDSVQLRELGAGYGDIAFRPTADIRASYVLLWPYVRPWRWGRVQPMIRAIPDVADVAAKLAAALAADTRAEAERPPAAAAPQQPVSEPAAEPEKWKPYPTVPLAAAVSLVVISLVATAWISFSGNSPSREVPTDVVASIDLRFEDREDGSVVVIDAENDAVLETLAPGGDGFLRSSMRLLAQSRRSDGVGADVPFSLMRTASGQLLLIDPVTGDQVDLWAFGKTNAGTFARFLARADETADLRTGELLQEDRESSTLTAAAYTGDEETP